MLVGKAERTIETDLVGGDLHIEVNMYNSLPSFPCMTNDIAGMYIRESK
jgi:hypothetical protein